MHTFIPFLYSRISLYLSLFDDNNLDETIISHGSTLLLCTQFAAFLYYQPYTYTYKLLYLMLSPNTTFYLRRHLKCHRILWHYLNTFYSLQTNKRQLFKFPCTNGILAKISVNQRRYYLCAHGIIITPVIRAHDIRPYAETSVCSSLPLPPSHLLLLKYQQEEFVHKPSLNIEAPQHHCIRGVRVNSSLQKWQHTVHTRR